MYFLHFANSSCAIVHLDPDHQLILAASCHLVEKLKTLKLPLWVEDPGFQQSRFLRFPSHCTEVHEVPSIYNGSLKKKKKLRQSETAEVSQWEVVKSLTSASAQECVIF